jgi:hypothetical protein
MEHISGKKSSKNAMKIFTFYFPGNVPRETSVRPGAAGTCEIFHNVKFSEQK